MQAPTSRPDRCSATADRSSATGTGSQLIRVASNTAGDASHSQTRRPAPSRTSNHADSPLATAASPAVTQRNPTTDDDSIIASTHCSAVSGGYSVSTSRYTAGSSDNPRAWVIATTSL